MSREILLDMEMSLTPLPCWCIRTNKEHRDSSHDNADERDNEGDPPGHMWLQALVGDQGLVDGGHQEVGDTAASITEPGRDGIGCADHVLVEKARRPDLAWNKRATENTDEEAARHQLRGIVACTSKRRRDCSNEQTGCKGLPRTVPIAGWPGDETHEETDTHLVSMIDCVPQGM